MLYQDVDLLRRDANGRRLYLAEEFDLSGAGHHRTERVHTPQTKSRTLVREEVFSLDDGAASVGLGRVAFAECVTNREGEFSSPIDFEGFRRTLKLIQEVVARTDAAAAGPGV